MSQDAFATHFSSLTGPATRLFEISPSNTDDLPEVSRAICVGESGWVAVLTAGGATGSIFVAAGVPFPIRVQRVLATGTTATGLRALV